MQLDISSLALHLWLTALGASTLLAGWQLLAPSAPLIKWQARIALLSTSCALIQLLVDREHPWPLISDSSSAWLLVTLVHGLGLIVQRFSRRFLLGDDNQLQAMAWLALLNSGAALAWVGTDSRLLLASWGLTLFSLFRLIGLARDWQAAQAAARYVGNWLLLAWVALAIVAGLIYGQSGSWDINVPASAANWPGWAMHLAALALLIAVVIPAAQWPVQRWLMTTMVVSSPVSAIMHAGLVNAGGILLLHYGNLLALSGWAQVALLLLATLSILIGSGILLVQVDVKRQLAASTVAQMGCMLLQCALGAYIAAVIHLLLHGLFKASLFLQAGGTVNVERRGIALPGFSKILALAAPLAGGLIWLAPSFQNGPAAWLSATLLSWALAQGLASLPVSQWRSLPTWVGVLGGFATVQLLLHQLLASSVPAGLAPAPIWVFSAAALLLLGTAAIYRLHTTPQTPLAQRVYWQLVSLGEAPNNTFDAHPPYLAHRAQQGVLA